MWEIGENDDDLGFPGQIEASRTEQGASIIHTRRRVFYEAAQGEKTCVMHSAKISFSGRKKKIVCDSGRESEAVTTPVDPAGGYRYRSSNKPCKSADTASYRRRTAE